MILILGTAFTGRMLALYYKITLTAFLLQTELDNFIHIVKICIRKTTISEILAGRNTKMTLFSGMIHPFCFFKYFFFIQCHLFCFLKAI